METLKCNLIYLNKIFNFEFYAFYDKNEQKDQFRM